MAYECLEVSLEKEEGIEEGRERREEEERMREKRDLPKEITPMA